MPSVTLYRISGADLENDSVAAVIDSSEAALVEIALRRGIPCRLFVFRDPPEVPEWAQYLAAITVWPAPGSENTELGVFMGPEVDHGETKVYTGVQA